MHITYKQFQRMCMHIYIHIYMHINTSFPEQKKGHMHLGINYTTGIHSPFCKYSVIEGSRVPQVSGHSPSL